MALRAGFRLSEGWRYPLPFRLKNGMEAEFTGLHTGQQFQNHTKPPMAQGNEIRVRLGCSSAEGPQLDQLAAAGMYLVAFAEDEPSKPSIQRDSARKSQLKCA